MVGSHRVRVNRGEAVLEIRKGRRRTRRRRRTNAEAQIFCQGTVVRILKPVVDFTPVHQLQSGDNRSYSRDPVRCDWALVIRFDRCEDPLSVHY